MRINALVFPAPKLIAKLHVCPLNALHIPGVGALEMKQTIPSLESLLTTPEVAEILRCSESRLNKLRVSGGGPKFTKLGNLVRYRPVDVADYVSLNLRGSTSDEREREGAS